MRRLRILLTFLPLIISASSVAQSFDLDKDRQPVASLNGLWRFHAGDNPAWADPNFDDSGWSLLHSDRSWAEQGYPGYEGFAWYRFQLLIPPSLTDISINPPMIANSYEVYADGVLIGAYGKMPPHRELMTFNRYVVYKVPQPSGPPAPASRKVSIAIRVSFWKDLLSISDGGPISSIGLLVGDSRQVRLNRELTISSLHWRFASAETLGFLRLLTGFGTIAFFLVRRKDFEYLWFSINMFCAGADSWLYILSIFRPFRLPQVNLWLVFIELAGKLAILGFYRQLLRPHVRWLFKAAVICVLLGIPLILQSNLWQSLLPEQGSDILAILLDVPFYVWIVVALSTTARHKSKSDSRWIDARLLLVPALLDALMYFYREACYLVYYLGWSHVIPLAQRYQILEEPFPIEIGQVAEALWLLGIFAVLVLRFARTRSEQERYASEVEGARHVQQFLIPDDLPKIPGLIFESDYRPAREVGGDFFQVIPDPEDGSALVFVGDVAGKGMQAGMLATLLVGSMRTAATFTRDPVIILSTLNNRLHGKGNATCLSLRIRSEGAATLVNAGHLPPYLNGLELPMEGALPLGTIPNNDFPILRFQISPGDTLTLITDGILEAQKTDGELFGFERITQHLAVNSTASSLATAAQNFGQEDDITVLTIARVSFAV